MYKPAWKIIDNRTRGLQSAVIEDSFTEEKCKTCLGKGTYNVLIPSNMIRNLKGKIEHVTITNDCTTCEGGVVKSKIRVIRKNKITAII
jgi:hypothetical protein